MRKITLLLLGSFFLSACQTTTYEFFSTRSENYKLQMPQDISYSKKYSNLLTSGIIKNNIQSMFGVTSFSYVDNEYNSKRLKEINSSIIGKFTYKYDGRRGRDDSWDSGLMSLISQKKFRGDCEDLALTSMEIAHLSGFPKERLYKILTLSRVQGSGSDMHMIAGYMDNNGEMWVFGDTLTDYPKKLNSLTHIHSPIFYSRMDWNSYWQTPQKTIREK